MKSIEERLIEYGKDSCVRPNESIIRETILKAKKCFYEAAEQGEITYFEFLYEQIGYIGKQWWIWQFFALFFTGCLLREIEDVFLVQRLMSISATLFVIMVIPELWKSRRYHSLEIEGVSYFSLRQIYAARMLIFAIVDSIFLSFFAGAVLVTMIVSIEELVIHFFLPMIVTCCICLHALCGRYEGSEYAACFVSLLWSSIWTLFVSNENIYRVISIPVWFAVCCMAILFLTYTVRKVIRECDNTV